MNALFAEAIGSFRDNDMALFEKLVKQYPQLLEIRRRGRSLLTYALLYDRLRVMQIILKKLPRFLDSEENAEYVLHWTVQADARKCCKYMLGLPRQPCETPWIMLKNRRHITPIHLAARYGHVKILKVSFLIILKSEI
ncbi:unnamed protein product [Gongylonema pulchrum]|uniref:ANK_REP_REGION domain-containing protein n=1 Tax=Gongylonema pulchrum TaxID=637853 RepID=A0A183DFZ0_9BILA|nr:unnamed protein product [Gongylonema pulchrum]